MDHICQYFSNIFYFGFFKLFASFSNSRWLCDYFILFQLMFLFFFCLFLIEIALRHIYPLTQWVLFLLTRAFFILFDFLFFVFWFLYLFACLLTHIKPLH